MEFLIQPAFAEAASRRQVAVSRLRGRSRYGAAKARLDQKKTLLSDLCGSAVSLILKGAPANQKAQ
jgi:hypothetical protein